MFSIQQEIRGNLPGDGCDTRDDPTCGKEKKFVVDLKRDKGRIC